MQLGIHTLQVGKGDLLLQDHLVEGSDEIGIEESTVEDTETKTSTNELEVVQVLRVHSRRRVDLQGVVVVRRVLEQAVEGVEHLVREQEEEFPIRHTSEVIQELSERATHLERPS